MMILFCIMAVVAVLMAAIAIAIGNRLVKTQGEAQDWKEQYERQLHVAGELDLRRKKVLEDVYKAEDAQLEAEKRAERAETGFRKLQDGMKKLLGIRVGLTPEEKIKRGLENGEADLAHGATFRVFKRPPTGMGAKVRTAKGPLGATAEAARKGAVETTTGTREMAENARRLMGG